MSTKLIVQNIWKRGKEILQDVLGKQRFGTVPRYESRIPVKRDVYLKQSNTKPLESNTKNSRKVLIGRLFPDISVRSFSGELRRRTLGRFNQYGRLLRPTFAFGFAGMALKTNLNEDENLSAEVRKMFSHREGKLSLVEQVQELSLDVFEFGNLIGQGCNAAVYEAKINRSDLQVGEHSIQTSDAEDIFTDVSMDTETDDGESDIIVLDQDLEDSEAQEEALFDIVMVTANQCEAQKDVSQNDSWDSDSIVLLNESSEHPPCQEGMSEINVVMVTTNHNDSAEKQSDTGSGGYTLEEEYNLAIKMMYNYDVESNTEAIMRVMMKEAVPARMSITQADDHLWQNSNRVRLKSLPVHPNIVEMLGVFVDPVPALSGAVSQYPAALPQRLNPTGLGRNKTMFLVMKKYDQTLREYLAQEQPCLTTRCLLLAQLLEGVLHLQNHGIAHRDLKSDNILLKQQSEMNVPDLVISDFGCCLADPQNGFKLPYTTAELDRGGNGALMPPEIKCAVPGNNVVLDYKKYDMWTVGSLVYEIFGADNPFYGGPTCDRKLDSRTYREEDLPCLPDDVPEVIQVLTRSILSRNPKQRPSPVTSANLLQILLWFPDWLLPGNKPTNDQALESLMMIVAEILFIRRSKGHKSISASNQLKMTLLRRLNIAEMLDSLELYHAKF